MNVALPQDTPQWARLMFLEMAELRRAFAQQPESVAVSPAELTTKEAMARLGYRSSKRFWQAVRRLGIPYAKISGRHVMFAAVDIDAALAAKRVGVRRPGARGLAA